VPFDFSCLQKTKIQTIAETLGIGEAFCGSGIEYQAFSRPVENEMSFFAQIEADRIEFGIVDICDGIYDVLGFNGIRLNSSDRSEQVRTQLNTEVKQFLKDMNDAAIPETLEFLNVFGDVYDPAVKWLEEAFGKTAVLQRCNATKGALRHELVWQGSEVGMLLQCVPNNLSLALGENGERGIVVPHYDTYPVEKSIRLLVSTETTLHVYEGNYSNPRFDTKIGSVSLAEIPEGHEVECTLKMDVRGRTRLVVRNEQGVVVFDKSLHELS